MKTTLYVLAGVSGSGKSTALSAFEDLGFFCVDNLPTPLVRSFVDLLLNPPEDWSGGLSKRGTKGEGRRFALHVDARHESETHTVIAELSRFQTGGGESAILFFDCQDDVLVKRFQETRRPHPLRVSSETTPPITLREALARERSCLAELREKALHVVDTAGFSSHALRGWIEDLVGETRELQVVVQSFGFKHGIPSDADLVFDVRFLPNPHFVPELKELTGLEPRVRDYVFESGEADELVGQFLLLLRSLVPKYRHEGKSYLTVAVGCTGGKHRSVAVAQELANQLRRDEVGIIIRHRDKDRS